MAARMSAMRMAAVFEGLELMEDRVAVEGADVTRLGLRQATDRPREMHEVRPDGTRERDHPDLGRKAVALARVAGRAGRHDVRPVVRAAARHRDHVVARERLARLELRRGTTAVLAAVVVAREQERVRDLTPEAPRDVDELR